MKYTGSPLAQWAEGRHYSVTADLLSDGWAVFDCALRPLYFSPSLQTLTGYDQSLLKPLWARWLKARSAPQVFQHLHSELGYIAQLFRQDNALTHHYLSEPLIVQSRSGEPLHLEVKALSLHDSAGRFDGILCAVKNVTERWKDSIDEVLANRVFNNSLVGVYVTDPEGNIERVNDTFCRMTGYSVAEVVGCPSAILSIDGKSLQVSGVINAGLASKGSWEGEVQHRHKRGNVFTAAVDISELRDADGSVSHRVICFHDIVERKNSSSKIQQLAFFDPLTKLPNRSLLLDRLERSISRARRNNHYVAVFFLDLDQFKQVNDQLGHAAGDQLLCQVAQRLSECVRAEDTVARLSGDEFVVVLNGLQGRNSALQMVTRMARTLNGALARPFDIGKELVQSSCSIGIALFPEDGVDVENLLNRADKAMYHVKHNGKQGYKFYTPALDNSSKHHVVMAKTLEQAITNNEFLLHYQPILDIKSGSVVALEALLRWQHRERGLLQPVDFIEALERCESLATISQWVLNGACEQMRELIRCGSLVRRVTVNISKAQFYQTPLVQLVRRALAVTGMKPECLEIEIKESVLMHDINKSLDTLNALHRLGVMVALDNFGEGSSSMSVLKRLPMNRLKVNCGFADGPSGHEDQQMIRAVISMGHSLSLQVVGEGVETSAQLDFLQQQGCEEVQGYFLSKPQAAADLAACLH